MVTLNLPIPDATNPTYIVVGDTIQAVEFAFDSGIDLTGATIRMQVYNKLNQKVYDVDSTSGITINDALTFDIDKIAKEDNPFTEEGIYNGDVEITDASGDRLTYFRIRYTVQKQYTV